MSIARKIFQCARECGDFDAGFLALINYENPSMPRRRLGTQGAEKIRWTFRDGSSIFVPLERGDDEFFWIEEPDGRVVMTDMMAVTGRRSRAY